MSLADGEQTIFAQNLILSAVYYKGDTVFRPPDYEYRFTGVVNYNRVDVDEVRALKIDPDDGTTRTDSHFGVQDMYVDKHLRNVSERYDFDSVRFGVQPITADFRGFLFIDNPVRHVRLFGTRDNNIYQYNLAWFRRIEKDTNSGLNDLVGRLARRRHIPRQPLSPGFPGARLQFRGGAAAQSQRAKTVSSSSTTTASWCARHRLVSKNCAATT